MKIDTNCLQYFFDETLPSIEIIEDALSLHSFETEIDKDGKLDVDILPNRSSDSLSYYGIAKELNTILGLKLKNRIIEDLKIDKAFGEDLSVSVDDDRCSRYMGALITGASTLKLPKQIIECIESAGMRSVNPIVDITNYVMLELGLPMHAFDADSLSVGKDNKFNIIVRDSKKEEKVKILKTDNVNNEYELSNIMLVVDGNSDKPIAIAGIKGLDVAPITASTDKIILEAAVFKHSDIRDSVRKLKLSTDASNRYSQNLSPNKAEYALYRAIELMRKFGTNIKVKSLADDYKTKTNPYKLGISSREITNYMGVDVTDTEVRDIFERLNFKFIEVNPREKIIEIAEQNIGKKYRLGASVSKDAPNEFDCSSFVAYCYLNAGIQMPKPSIDQFLYTKKITEDNIKPGDLIFMKGEKDIPTTRTKPLNDFVYYIDGEVPGGIDHDGIVVDRDTFIMAGCKDILKVVKKDKASVENYYKIIGYGRVIEDEEESRFVVTVPDDRIDIKQKEDLIEEFARIYGYENIPSAGLEISKTKINGDFYLEQEILETCKEFMFSEIKTSSFSKDGDIRVLQPKAEDKPKLRNNLRTLMSEALKLNLLNADLLGVTQIRLIEIGTVFLKDREEIRIGVAIKDLKEHKSRGGNSADKIFKDLLDKLNKKLDLGLNGKLEDGVWESVIKDGFKTEKEYPIYEISDKKFKNFSKYPFVTRDISIFVPAKIISDYLELILKEYGGRLLLSVKLFDEYEKEDKKSYAFRMVFQSDTRTLTDEEINEIMESIYSKLKSENFEIR